MLASHIYPTTAPHIEKFKKSITTEPDNLQITFLSYKMDLYHTKDTMPQIIVKTTAKLQVYRKQIY
jgi:hypothetical protein